MEYHLERETHLVERFKDKNLYSWSLQELDETGAKVGCEQEPWVWPLYFTASELRHNRSIRIEKPYNTEEDEESNLIEDSETITAILHPGICSNGQWLQYDTSFSMFGTDRRIKHFELNIDKLDEGDTNERCNLLGFVSYTTEYDAFREETTDDMVGINIWLSPQRFNFIAEIIKTQRADIVQINLGMVSGFYSEWSPLISTNNVKILTAYDDQKIVFPEGCDVRPPKLGKVGEFKLSIIQRNKLNPKQDLRSIDIYKFFEEHDEMIESCREEEFAETEPDVNALLLTQLSRNELALKKLRTPLWLIFILLLLLFLKFAM